MQVFQHIGAIIWPFAQISRHIGQDWFFAQVEPHHFRHVRINGLIIGNAATWRIGKCYIASAIGFHQPAHTKH